MAGGVREIELTLTVFDAIEGLFRGFGGNSAMDRSRSDLALLS